MNKEFWNDIAAKGAIVGALMLVSHIFEQMAVIAGSITWLVLTLPEQILAAVLYIYLLCRFTKQASKKYFRPESGFPYGLAVEYVVCICFFAGILVGLGDYIYVHNIVGYDNYVEQLTENIHSMLAYARGVPSTFIATYDDMLAKLAEQPEPGIWNTISATIARYGMTGLFIGLIIAAIVKRNPDPFDSGSGNEKEI